jgi:twitching motility protein PilT
MADRNVPISGNKSSSPPIGGGGQRSSPPIHGTKSSAPPIHGTKSAAPPIHGGQRQAPALNQAQQAQQQQAMQQRAMQQRAMQQRQVVQGGGVQLNAPNPQAAAAAAAQAAQIQARVQAQAAQQGVPLQQPHAQPAAPGSGVALPTDPGLQPLERLFALMSQYDASDLHLKAGCPVVMRVKGEMRPLQANPLSTQEIYQLLQGIATPAQMKLFDDTGDLDFAHRLPDKARSRFRLNVFRDRRNTALVARRINTHIPSFAELNLPGDSLVKLLEAEDGLIVLAGVTGSGKSTTIAGMIDWINTNKAKHIITVEDPIEYEFQNKRSYISQREIGTDCLDWKAAIKTLVRQDPDVILIGEMRDQETFDFGLTAAETGHLVFGTLHAGTVPQSIGRVLGLFPTEKHRQLRQGLQFNLRGIVCQKLIPSPTHGRVPINEILISTPIVKKFLAEGEDKKLNGVMRGGREDGMFTFDQCLLERTKAGLIMEEVATQYATNPEQFKLALQGITIGGTQGGISG